ncbi:MAG TPA: hypothetical protein VGJ69_08710 [Pyrinomonadaceae bacterium]|jgi:hypothetical protein|nr:hypothetical protein [Pyrinomonadaceae bacterium]
MQATEQQETEPKLELIYTLLCDDVRLEVGNKLSYMGVFQSIIVPQLPVWLPKLAVVNHWRGNGVHLSEVRILMPDRQQALVVSQPARFEINQGSADNISFFVNVTFPVAGEYWVQTLVDSNLFEERGLLVSDQQLISADEETSEAVN